MLDHLPLVDARDRLAKRPLHAGRIERRADDDAGEGARILLVAHIHHRVFSRIVERRHALVGDDADDVEPRRVARVQGAEPWRVHQQALADRVVCAKKLSRHRFVDDGDERGRLAIDVAQRAAAAKPQAERAEVARTDEPEVGDGTLDAFEERTTRNLNECEARRALHRHAVGECDVAHAGDGLDVRDDLVHEGVEFCCSGEAMFGDRQFRGEHVRRIEAGVGVTHVQETSDQQTGVGQQHERERDFRDDQPVAEMTGARRPGGGATESDRGAPDGANRADGGREAERDAAGGREDGREQQHTPVERDRSFGGNQDRQQRKVERQRRERGFQERHREVADRDAQGSAGYRNHHALGQELLHHATMTRAEREPDGDFTFARQRARQHDVRDVDAADEQHHADRCQKYIERPLQLLAGNYRRVRPHHGAPSLVRVRVRSRKPRANGLQLGSSAIDGHARLQQTDGAAAQPYQPM